MPKRPHTTIAEHLTADVVDHHITAGKPIRLYDLTTPGLYLFIGDKSGGSTWFYASANKGTPALGPHFKFTVEQARQRASTFGPPSRKAVKLISSAREEPKRNGV